VKNEGVARVVGRLADLLGELADVGEHELSWFLQGIIDASTGFEAAEEYAGVYGGAYAAGFEAGRSFDAPE